MVFFAQHEKIAYFLNDIHTVHGREPHRVPAHGLLKHMFSMHRKYEAGFPKRDKRPGKSPAIGQPRGVRKSREPGRSARELFAKYRRLLAIGVAMLAVALSLAALAPEREETVAVLVAGRDLPAGSVLHAEDLRMVQVPVSLLPANGYGTAESIEGSRLAIPLAAGAPLLETMIIGPGLLAGSPPGTVAVPLRLNDASTATLLRAGQQVNVVLTEGNGFESAVTSQVLARSATILWTESSTEAGQDPMWGASGSGEDAGLVVVAAAPDVAESLAAGAQRGKLSVVLVN